VGLPGEAPEMQRRSVIGHGSLRSQTVLDAPQELFDDANAHIARQEIERAPALQCPIGFSEPPLRLGDIPDRLFGPGHDAHYASQTIRLP